MDKLGDIKLFIQVIKSGGLAAAGRKVGLSPASMTARINSLEKYYGVKLLNRTTRLVRPTEEGLYFYHSCERILSDLDQVESKIQLGKTSLSGRIKITAPSDLGRQHVSKVIAEFSKKYPRVQPFLHLSDGITNIIEDGFDVGIRFGTLSDSRLIAKKLATNYRVLCASPEYLAERGTPTSPSELSQHNCLAMVRLNEPMTTWYFKTDDGIQKIMIEAARHSNDGALIRQWALEGAGIALKSVWDIADDLKEKRLVSILDEYIPNFDQKDLTKETGIHVIYPNREFLPSRSRAFIEALSLYFEASDKAVSLLI